MWQTYELVKLLASKYKNICVVGDDDQCLVEGTLISTDEVVSIDASFDNFKYFDDINAEKLDLREEIEKLSENEKRLIKARYYEDLTQTETSKRLGISQVQVSRNENKILKKLRTNL